MGECLIVRRGGESYELPVLDASYPKDVTVTVGADTSASFSVSITTPGRPAEYTYQWYVNGSAVSGATSSSHVLSGLTSVATYSVYCTVTNKAGTETSRIATLTTYAILPTLNPSYPADVSVMASASASTTVNVAISTAGQPANYTYQWYVNGSAVSGATSSSYTLTGLTAAGKRTVYCIVGNAAGTVRSRTATITITRELIAYYRNGDECTSVTGGWVWNDGSEVTKNATNMFMSGVSSIRSSNKVDVTRVTTLYIRVTGNGKTDTGRFGLMSNAGTPITGSVSLPASVNGIASSTTEKTYAVDVSSISGTYYLVIGIRNAEQLTVYEVWGEV